MTINRVKAAITDKAMSAEELILELEMSESAVRRSLTKLRSEELIHIENWYLPLGSTRLASRHRLGNKPDAIKPAMEEVLTGRKISAERLQYLEKQREYAAAAKARQDARERERLKPPGQVLIAANDPYLSWVLRKEA